MYIIIIIIIISNLLEIKAWVELSSTLILPLTFAIFFRSVVLN